MVLNRDGTHATYSFEQIGQELGVDEVYAAAIFYGQVYTTLAFEVLDVDANWLEIKQRPNQQKTKSRS